MFDQEKNQPGVLVFFSLSVSHTGMRLPDLDSTEPEGVLVLGCQG